MNPLPLALLSVHDVMPETLGRVERILRSVDAAGWRPPALLVVPGRDWSATPLRRLRQWERDGCELLAHGWRHETQPRKFLHRLHAALLSRNVAEHLALDEDGVTALMHRSRDWFVNVGLTAPQTYVPPAWALGIPAARLGTLPYTCVETLSGVHLRGPQGHWRFRALPLAGFEADTPGRAAFLRLSNYLQCGRARRRQLPLRIAIHPADTELRLSTDLATLLQGRWTPLRYAELHPLVANACMSGA
jgi:predicted deacetylase